jgi:hypothetical protein
MAPRAHRDAPWFSILFGRQVLRWRRACRELVLVVLEHLAQVAHVEKSAAERAALEMVALARNRFTGLAWPAQVKTVPPSHCSPLPRFGGGPVAPRLSLRAAAITRQTSASSVKVRWLRQPG